MEETVFILQHSMNFHLKANDGNNCHNIAAFQGHLSLCKMLMDKHKIDLHMSNNDGWTALHYSAQRGNSEVVAYFAEMGTDRRWKKLSSYCSTQRTFESLQDVDR